MDAHLARVEENLLGQRADGAYGCTIGGGPARAACEDVVRWRRAPHEPD